MDVWSQDLGDKSNPVELEWKFAGPQTLPGGGFYVSGTAYGAGRWVATSWGWVTTSIDGHHWSYPVSVGRFDNHWSQLAYLGNRFVLWGTNGMDPLIAVSEDGLNWNPVMKLGSTSETGIITSVAYGNGIYVAVGRSHVSGESAQKGTVWTSTDGGQWSRIYRTSDTAQLNAVAYGDGQFFSVGDSGFGLVSDNGVDWLEKNPLDQPGNIEAASKNVALTGICHGDQGWIVTGTDQNLINSLVFLSLDAAQWEIIKSPNNQNGWLNAISAGYYNSFFADGSYWFSDGGTQAYRTVDGRQWQAIGYINQQNVSSISFSGNSDSPRYIGGGMAGVIYTSDDGFTWESNGPQLAIWPDFQTIIGRETEWVLSGQDITITNWSGPEGENFKPWLNAVVTLRADENLVWTSSVDFDLCIVDYANGPEDLIASAVINKFSSGQSSNLLRTGVLREGALLNPVELYDLPRQTSAGTQTLTRLHSPALLRETARATLTQTPAGFEQYAEYNLSFRFPDPDRIITGHLISEDGVNWTRRMEGLNDVNRFPGIHGIAYGSGIYVAVGNGKAPGIANSADRIFTSIDGEQYNALPVDAVDFALGGEGLTGLVFNKGRFVAVGDQGRILVSQDGLQWVTTRFSDGLGWNRIRFLNNGFAVVGEQGRVAFSRDGNEWRESDTGVSISLNDIGYRTGEYLVAGEKAMVMHVDIRALMPSFLESIHTDKVFYEIGDSVTISTEVGGAGPFEYNWYRIQSDGTEERIPGNNGASYQFIVGDSDRETKFYLVVENEFGRIVSDIVSPNLIQLPEPTMVQHLTAVASSELSDLGRTAEGSVDGKYCDSAFWQSVGIGFLFDQSDREPFLLFDLGQTWSLDHFLFWNSHEYNSAVKRMMVQVSQDGVEFESHSVIDLPTPTLDPCPQDPVKIPMHRFTARFIKLVILENYAGLKFPAVNNPSQWSFVAVNEVEFYGNRVGLVLSLEQSSAGMSFVLDGIVDYGTLTIYQAPNLETLSSDPIEVFKIDTIVHPGFRVPMSLPVMETEMQMFRAKFVAE